MADGFEATMDTGPVLAALARLGDSALKYTNPASEVTADNLIREMQARVRRATGETADGIQKFPMHSGEGYVVVVINRRMPNLPLWIEGGTQQGKPGSHAMPAAPFFWPSVQLEAGAHEQRISAAVADGISAEGLGD